ncbi:hypothetical protein, partial [Photobacterium sanguinicancri]
MKYYRWSLIIALFSFQTQALEVYPTGARYENLVMDIVNNTINPLLSSRWEDKDVTDNIWVIVEPANGIANSFGRAVALPGNPRRIIISEDFIYGLGQYIAADIISYELNDHHLTERYFNYLFWRLRPVNEGPPPVTVDKWINFTPENLGSYQRNILTFQWLALTDVLLHEVGHHVNDGFYTHNTSAAIIRRIEAEADNWSREALADEFPGVSSIGRIFSVGYIYELDRVLQQIGSQTHPPHLNRILGTIGDLCIELGESQKDLCERLYVDAIRRFESKGTEEEYEARVAEGEAYAHFPLANILLRRGNIEEACRHYKLAWDKARVERAAVHVGSCYDNVYLRDKTNVEALQQAKRFYAIAADLGFVDARAYI